MIDIHSETCPECGTEYFHAIPGKTTQLQIKEFLDKMGEDSSDPNIHPGAYCPSGCETGYLATYSQELSSGALDERYDLVINSRPNSDSSIILYLKRVFGWTLKEGRDKIREGSYPIKLHDGALWQMQERRDELLSLGAAVSIPNEPTNSTFTEVIEELINNRYPAT